MNARLAISFTVLIWVKAAFVTIGLHIGTGFRYPTLVLGGGASVQYDEAT